MEIDTAATNLGATRSELVRAAMRQYLRQLAVDEQLLARVRSVPRADEDTLGRQALAARRARRARATG